jgi:hypothetical protein
VLVGASALRASVVIALPPAANGILYAVDLAGYLYAFSLS